MGLEAINNSISKAEALAEKQKLDDFQIWFRAQFVKKGYTWATRERMQREAHSKKIAENIDARTIKINSILSNSNNIDRWEKEELKKQEDERLIQAQLENEKLEKERLEQEELIWNQLKFLENNANEIDSFYDFDKTVKEIDDDIQSIDSNEGIETIEGIEGMNGINSMSNQIPLEKITPVMLLLGAGIAVYLFGSGRFDKK